MASAAQEPVQHGRCVVTSSAMLGRAVRAWWLVSLGALACGDVDPIDPVVYGTSTGGISSTSTSTNTTTTTSGVTVTASATGGTGVDASTGGDTGFDTGGTAGSASATEGATTGPCEVGEESCPCTAEGACDPGLACLSQVCVDPGNTCPVGSEGCPCTMGGGCDPGLQCLSNTCVDPND